MWFCSRHGGPESTCLELIEIPNLALGPSHWSPVTLDA